MRKMILFMVNLLGRTAYQTKRYFIIIKYWFKIVTARNDKYIRIIYELMLRDIENLPTKVNWASLVKNLFMTLGYYEVWVNQGVGDYDIFMRSIKQRLNDNFVQNWHSRLEESSRAFFLKTPAAEGSFEVSLVCKGRGVFSM